MRNFTELRATFIVFLSQMLLKISFSKIFVKALLNDTMFSLSIPLLHCKPKSHTFEVKNKSLNFYFARSCDNLPHFTLIFDESRQ